MKRQTLLLACVFAVGITFVPVRSMACSAGMHTESVEDADSVYGVVDKLAKFPGGDEGLAKYFAKNLHFPEEMRRQGKTGIVHANFVVTKEGVLKDVTILKSPDEGFNAEVIRMLESMPKWKPAKVKGKKVSQRMILPVVFR